MATLCARQLSISSCAHIRTGRRRNGGRQTAQTYRQINKTEREPGIAITLPARAAHCACHPYAAASASVENCHSRCAHAAHSSAACTRAHLRLHAQRLFCRYVQAVAENGNNARITTLALVYHLQENLVYVISVRNMRSADASAYFLSEGISSAPATLNELRSGGACGIFSDNSAWLRGLVSRRMRQEEAEGWPGL